MNMNIKLTEMEMDVSLNSHVIKKKIICKPNETGMASSKVIKVWKWLKRFRIVADWMIQQRFIQLKFDIEFEILTDSILIPFWIPNSDWLTYSLCQNAMCWAHVMTHFKVVQQFTCFKKEK